MLRQLNIWNVGCIVWLTANKLNTRNLTDVSVAVTTRYIHDENTARLRVEEELTGLDRPWATATLTWLSIWLYGVKCGGMSHRCYTARACLPLPVPTTLPANLSQSSFNPMTITACETASDCSSVTGFCWPSGAMQARLPSFGRLSISHCTFVGPIHWDWRLIQAYRAEKTWTIRTSHNLVRFSKKINDLHYSNFLTVLNSLSDYTPNFSTLPPESRTRTYEPSQFSAI